MQAFFLVHRFRLCSSTALVIYKCKCLSCQIHWSTICIFEGPYLNSKLVLSWDFCLKWTIFVLLILMQSSLHSHQKWSSLSIHWRSFSVSAMRAMSSANLRRSRINSPHFSPKPSFFIFSIRALMKRLKSWGSPVWHQKIPGLVWRWCHWFKRENMWNVEKLFWPLFSVIGMSYHGKFMLCTTPVLLSASARNTTLTFLLIPALTFSHLPCTYSVTWYY